MKLVLQIPGRQNTQQYAARDSECIGKGEATAQSPTLGVLAAAGTCGEAAWPAWLDTEVDLLGEAPRDEGRDLRPRGRKAAIPWLAPSARMNFSRSSMLVRPLAGFTHAAEGTEKKRKHSVFAGVGALDTKEHAENFEDIFLPCQLQLSKTRS